MQSVCAVSEHFHPVALEQQFNQFARLALPICGNLDVVYVHAGQYSIRALLGAKAPQDLQATHHLKTTPADELASFRVLPKPYGKANIAIHFQHQNLKEKPDGGLA